MLTNRYKFLFVLDKTSMFTIKSVKRDGSSVVHHVKPLQLIWSKFPQYGSHNTIHIDDLAHNFALNLKSGLKCRAYIRKKKSARRDTELLGLTRYLDILANAKIRFDAIEHSAWEDVVSGKRPLLKKGEEETRAATK
jgi:ubiquitin-like domain-containing CTD phosphatase 1